MKPVKQNTDGSVSALYAQLREMSASFAFKPGQLINESALSRDLGASRTPLREALNRLVAEGLVDFHAGRGFFCRALSETRIQHLYDVRVAIECQAVRQATQCARTADLDAIDLALDQAHDEYQSCTAPIRLMELDEAFHMQLTALTGNVELQSLLATIYDKVRFVRIADLRRRQAEGRSTIDRHKRIIAVMRTGDGMAASEAMRYHIQERAQHAAEAVRLAYADIYAPQEASE